MTFNMTSRIFLAHQLSLSRKCLPVRHAMEYNKRKMPPSLLLPAGGRDGYAGREGGQPDVRPEIPRRGPEQRLPEPLPQVYRGVAVLDAPRRGPEQSPDVARGRGPES
ncbi:hypothetical protein VMCG_07441 [Cytospora schulzeri]|uniref:Uncharacterized protein n=1 Tax=Cytospora schulzeri TaxID=448051 RepID=A0A423W2Y2_9PEZI|nr:hypothetical protein VMCG_07441 [Valsa malicola]